jgi:anthranilate synthase component 1
MNMIEKIPFKTSMRKMLADVYTPVGIYLRLRDRFRDTILLESSDHHSSTDNWSFICIQAVAGIELINKETIEYKLPGQEPVRFSLNSKNGKLPDFINDFMIRFDPIQSQMKEEKYAQGLYGYTSYDAVRFFESVPVSKESDKPIGLMRYRLYQYVIAINHFKDELFLLENHFSGYESESASIIRIIQSRDVPQFPFQLTGKESSNMTDEDYLSMVKKGIASCMRGDVFQIVLSRRFQQSFLGDEFNVYRALRSVNPSPYLFYFDYGDYRLMGSSPESQLIIQDGKAIVHPIAGTFKRTGDLEKDKTEAARLLEDPKENAEHVMLVDLARNDLSRLTRNVLVEQYKEVHFYSHVIHLVSKVTGEVDPETNPVQILADSFPAGTLSGAPKVKAMQLIDEFEPSARSFYGGAIGFLGMDGTCNHAILIRSFLSIENTLYYQAGAGVVVASNPELELQEVNNKLGALKKAIQLAETLHWQSL